jgi:hypothetical protein
MEMQSLVQELRVVTSKITHDNGMDLLKSGQPTFLSGPLSQSIERSFNGWWSGSHGRAPA